MNSPKVIPPRPSSSMTSRPYGPRDTRYTQGGEMMALTRRSDARVSFSVGMVYQVSGESMRGVSGLTNPLISGDGGITDLDAFHTSLISKPCPERPNEVGAPGGGGNHGFRDGLRSG